MARKRGTHGQGSVYQRNGWWWCGYSVAGVRHRESCETRNRDEALAWLKRKQGKLACGELLVPERVRVRDLLALVLDDYDVRGVAQSYIAGLKVKSILNPRLGDVRATTLTTEQVKNYIRDRLKSVKPGTVNRELSLLHRAYQLGYQHDPPLVGRVPRFPKLPESEPRRGFLKPELYRKVLFELPEDLRLLFVIAYHVGLRRGALLRIKWAQVDFKASCIWMEGKRINRKPEPSRSRSTATWASFSKYNRRKANTYSRAGCGRSKIFAKAGTSLANARAFLNFCSMICEGLPSEICGGRELPRASL
jgi:hypothetical protein